MWLCYNRLKLGSDKKSRNRKRKSAAWFFSLRKCGVQVERRGSFSIDSSPSATVLCILSLRLACVLSTRRDDDDDVGAGSSGSMGMNDASTPVFVCVNHRWRTCKTGQIAGGLLGLFVKAGRSQEHQDAQSTMGSTQAKRRGPS